LIKNKTFCGDGILTSNYLPWESDINLLDAYNLSFENIPAKYKTVRSMQFRAHIVTFCAHMAQGVKGDYIELGTWYGVLAKTICNQPELVTDRNFYLVDPFGMPGFKMKGKYKTGSYEEDIFEIVRYRFRNDSCVKLIRGVVPEILSSIPVDKVAFLLIDMNHGEPEIQGLEFFWSKIPSGGIVYFDDYGQNFPELRKHIDLFLEDKKERILVFPTGQAVLIKM
jgi:O-methyltransferase